jgi:imidazolonepropionase-like amidohydrolase
VVDSAAAVALRRSGVRVISTLASLGPRPDGAEVVASFRRLRVAGVPIILGTDAGVLAHGRNARELVALTDAGLTPAQALRAATTDAARLLGRSDLGKIEVGGVADFVVVKGDPLQDITLLQHPEMVVQGGRTVH